VYLLGCGVVLSEFIFVIWEELLFMDDCGQSGNIDFFKRLDVVESRAIGRYKAGTS